MIQDIEKAIREYLPNIIHMSLGTCVENKPWVSEVHFVFDEDLNIYFRSKSTTRHCKEIEINPNVAGNIITQHDDRIKPRGIYFEGRAEKLENVPMDGEFAKLFQQRFGTELNKMEDQSAETGHSFYKITVTNFAVFDARESTPAQKYELKWK